MTCSQEVVAALAPIRRAHSDGNLEWIKSGLFGAAYPALLVETYHYVSRSVELLACACSRLGWRPYLQRYLIKHMGEEIGHEQWALQDLEVLGLSARDVTSSRPLSETLSLVGTQFFLIERVSPLSILGYIYAMESMAPHGPLLQIISDIYDIPIEAMTFLSKHGEADIGHLDELLTMIDESVTSSEEKNHVTQSATIAIKDLERLVARLKTGDFLRSP